jgi:hypothetical protein
MLWVHLREVYERNIQSLSVICSPIPSATPSIEDYILWLTSEVGYLPEVFASVNGVSSPGIANTPSIVAETEKQTDLLDCWSVGGRKCPSQCET